MSKIPLVFKTRAEAEARRLSDADVLATAARRFVNLRRDWDEYQTAPTGTVITLPDGITNKEHFKEAVEDAEADLRDALVKWELFECTWEVTE